MLTEEQIKTVAEKTSKYMQIKMMTYNLLDKKVNEELIDEFIGKVFDILNQLPLGYSKWVDYGKKYGYYDYFMEVYEIKRKINEKRT